MPKNGEDFSSGKYLPGVKDPPVPPKPSWTSPLS